MLPRPGIVALGAAALMSACVHGAITPAPSARALQWVQVWHDEFDGAVNAPVDSVKWRYDIGDGCVQRICGWGNNEKESYSARVENVSLNGQGQLRIVARVNSGGALPADSGVAPKGDAPRADAGSQCYYGPCRYTSGKLTTRGVMTASAGRVEARIRLPAGQGLWPAFWLLGSGCPEVPWPLCGELDIMENHGSAPAATSSAMHGPGYSGNTPLVHSHAVASAAASGFHVYAVEWDSLHVAFFVDDSAHYVVNRPQVEHYGKWVYDNSFIVILNLAVGGTFDGDPASNAIFPATMLVDYVRVYTRRP